MTRWLWLLWLWPLAALADDPPQLWVEARLQPPGEVVVGSTVHLEVDVLTDAWFTHAPQLPTLQLPGALVQPPSGEAENINTTRHGKNVFGLRYVYLITPNQAQAFAIAPLTVRAKPGLAPAAITATSAALNFIAQQPPGFTPGEPVLVAQGLRFTQRIQHAGGPLKVGDTLVRELRLEADGTQAMLLPAPVFNAVEGLGTYPAAPQIEAISDGRGLITGGRRIDSVSYRINNAGHFELPAIELSWWDSANQQKRSASVPAFSFTAQANAAYAPPFSIAADLQALGQHHRLHLTRLWLVAALLGVVVLLATLAKPWWQRGRNAWQQARQRRRHAWLNSAEYAWQQVPAQLHKQPPELSALYLWLHRRTGLTTFSQLPLAPAHALLGLLNERYAARPGSAVNWPALEHALPALQRSLKPAKSKAAHALKALNPSHTPHAKERL